MAKPSKAFWLRLHALGFQTWNEYLLSPQWATTKARFRESKLYKRKCQRCLARSVPIQIHHKTYSHIGAERMYDLVALCRPCHEYVHQLEKRQPNAKLLNVTRRAIRRGQRDANRAKTVVHHPAGRARHTAP